MPPGQSARDTMLRRLWRDERGQILLMFSIMVPVIMGMVGLGLEYNRVLMLQSELQNVADAAALAGAKRLDRGSGAIAAAIADATDFGNNHNYTRWSDDNTGVRIASVKVYDSLADLDAGTESTRDTTAAYVKVVTVYKTVNPMFILAAGAIGSKSVRATATAESQYVACNVQPLMLCNPNEPNDFNPAVGAIFGFTEAGSTQGFSPGVFSLLDPPGQTHSSAPDIKINLSSVGPKFCYIDNVSPRTGEIASTVAQAVNVRFDMQPNNTTNLDVTPADNVIKGDKNNSCLRTTNNGVTASAELPLNLGTTSIGGTVQGGSLDTMNANAYWNYHHGGNWPSVGGAPITRYAAYQGENNGTYPFIAGTENPTPSPYCAGVSPVANRRILSVAVVNCNEQNVTGNSVPNLQSAKYADFFLIRPVDQQGPNNGIVWTEFVRMMTPQADGSKLHQVVQLVRDF